MTLAMVFLAGALIGWRAPAFCWAWLAARRNGASRVARLWVALLAACGFTGSGPQ